MVERVTGRKSDSNVPRALELFKELTALVSLTRECLGASPNRMKQYADQKRRDLEFVVGEQVLLFTKYLRLRLLRESSKYTAKLMPRYIGPYAIEAEVGKVSYRLELDTTMKVHLVFHVSLNHIMGMVCISRRLCHTSLMETLYISCLECWTTGTLHGVAVNLSCSTRCIGRGMAVSMTDGNLKLIFVMLSRRL
jgi:hypothetical protein